MDFVPNPNQKTKSMEQTVLGRQIHDMIRDISQRTLHRANGRFLSTCAEESSNKLIARHLGMTEGTVKVHIRQMMRKFQVSNRTQLAVDRVALATESISSFDTRSQNGDGSATRRQQTLPFVSPATRYRSRVDGKH